MTDEIERQFSCTKCGKMHKINLRKDLLKNHESFPFAYFYLHGPVKDVLSTLYLDANLNIRGVESVRLNENDKIFSAEHTMSIVQNLVGELTKTQYDYNELQEKYEELQEKYTTLKLKGSKRKIEPIMNK